MAGSSRRKSKCSSISSTEDDLRSIQDLKVSFKGITVDEALAFKNKKTADNFSSFKTFHVAKPNVSDGPITNLNTTSSVEKIAASTIHVAKPFGNLQYATREGLVGGTTSNGHVITSTDKFVTLPSPKAVNSNDSDYTYTVNISYTKNGVTKSLADVPVWDLGPLNDKDDYWNPNYGSIPIYPYTYRIRDNWGYDALWRFDAGHW